MTKPTQAQIEAVRKELLSWVRVPADAAWDMEYVARKVLTAAAEVGDADRIINESGARLYVLENENERLRDELAALTAAAEVAGDMEPDKDEIITALRIAKDEIEDATIERCAQEAYHYMVVKSRSAEEVRAAIRALNGERGSIEWPENTLNVNPAATTKEA